MNDVSKNFDLDRRAKWEKLPQFQPNHVSKTVEVSEEDLKTLCLQTCSVSLFKFNVLSRISNAYFDQCKARSETPDEETRLRLCQENGLRVYKKFYEPRLKWFAQQREYLKHLRTDPIYHKTVLEILKRTRASPTRNVVLQDSLPLVSTQEFMRNLEMLQLATQSTQLAGDSHSLRSSLSDLINILS